MDPIKRLLKIDGMARRQSPAKGRGKSQIDEIAR